MKSEERSTINQGSVSLVPIIFASIALFLTTSLAFDHYQRGYLFTSRSIDESVFIDQALQRIATCNNEDHSRQKSLLYTLQAWAHLANSNRIRYWLGYKTLHGYLSHNDLAPHDGELHILIMAEDTPLLINLTRENDPSDYKLQIHPQWFIRFPSQRSYFPSKGIYFKLQNARFLNQNTNLSINIWPAYLNHSTDNSQMLAHTLDTDQSIFTPMDWTFPLEACVFSGIRVWCPARPKKLTDSMYTGGYTYLSCINGSWTNVK